MVGLALLAVAVAFTAWFAAPELRINRLPMNDLTFHLAASERIATSIGNGEPFLDPWVSEWSLGYPVWRSYQPLPHVAGAVALSLFRGLAAPASIFAAFYYFLLIAFPVSVYLGARLLGLSPPAAGLASLLVFAPASAGLLSGYDLGYASVVWRGIGLYTQLFALHFLVLSLGVTVRALDEGKRYQRVLAGILLALTLLSHIVFGYAAFVCAAVLALAGPAGRRVQRLIRLGTIALPALLLLAWFIVPLILAKQIVNHSRWEFAWKWDSFGARVILTELFSGRLLDGARLPFLTLLVAAGAVAAFLSRANPLARRLLVMTIAWLALFFGRETWGALTLLAGVPADLPMHRFQAVFELTAILLAAYGVTHLIQWVAARDRTFGALAVAAVVVSLGLIGDERAAFLNINESWGEANLAAWNKEGPDAEAALADVQRLLTTRPGRASAGLAATWGNEFKVGNTAFYSLLSRAHIDEASFLFHAMSKTSDVMVLRDEYNSAHDIAFGIRAVIAPAGMPVPPFLRRHSIHGRFVVYESSPEGYFGLVDLAGYYTGPPETDYYVNTAWLKSALVPAGVAVSLDSSQPVGRAINPGEELPAPTPEQFSSKGRVVFETKSQETYEAMIDASRPAWASIKITWNPDLIATVDGRPSPLLQITPGFGAVAIPAGQHRVTVEYKPGGLKPLLFLFGIVAFGSFWYFAPNPQLTKLFPALLRFRTVLLK